ncbi:MAG: S8 family serine peptidase [Bacteroidota bacterium]
MQVKSSGFLWFVLAICFAPIVVQGQSRYTLRVTFADKRGTPYSIQQPEDFLSEKALLRRAIQRVPVTYEDLPVSPVYTDSLKALGYISRNPSKWFNSVLVDVNYNHDISRILDLGFVVKTDMVAERNVAIPTRNKFDLQVPFLKTDVIPDSSDYGYGYGQIHLHNGEYLHQEGYTGKNVSVAVFDAGFYQVNTLPAFEHLWENNSIMGWKDFVHAGNDFFDSHTHGMNVLSIIGGKMGRTFTGTAPDADYWLLRTEDESSEMLIEEDNWTRAAEFADSAGVDIINTSLGYSLFDYEYMDHTYEDMNGKTTRISQAATKAAARGMLVVVSAGNEGNNPWYYITAPADADSIITVGAVNSNGEMAFFSSHGPTFDGRIKPTVVATGWNTYVQYTDGSIGPGNGTSFSAPVITGLAACLWQAHPEASNHELIQAIIKSAHKADNPDENYGFGIPDFQLAHELLELNYNHKSSQKISLKSDPVSGYPTISIQSKGPIGTFHVNIYSLNGQLLWSNNMSSTGVFEQITLNTFSTRKPGLYLINIRTSESEKTFKVFR